MSTYINPVVIINNIKPNPNSDSLDVWEGPQGPCQFRRGDFQIGDLVAFVPSDSLIPVTNPLFSNFKDSSEAKDGFLRIRGVKLRGMLSVGLLIPISGFSAGDDASSFLGTQKYQPPVWLVNPEYQRQLKGASLLFPTLGVYDVENAWRFTRYASKDKTVRQWRITEKIHGANWKIGKKDGKLYVGSRTNWLTDDCSQRQGEFWHAALELPAIKSLNLQESLEDGQVVFGEVFGPVQDLKYGGKGLRIRFFDIWQNGKFVTDTYSGPLSRHKLPELWVPTLNVFNGTLSQVIEHARLLAPGSSTLPCAESCIREGVVVCAAQEEIVALTDVSPTGKERETFQRLQFKVISPQYLSRKNSSEVQE
jgi:RNA ligase (TIGR02306 family)